MPVIHPSSLVDPKAELDESVVVGPFCIVEGKVKIGAGTVLMSHVTVRGSTTVGKGNRIFQGAAIGCEPQDKKYAGEDTVLIVGAITSSAKTARFPSAPSRTRGLRGWEAETF